MDTTQREKLVAIKSSIAKTEKLLRAMKRRKEKLAPKRANMRDKKLEALKAGEEINPGPQSCYAALRQGTHGVLCSHKIRGKAACLLRFRQICAQKIEDNKHGPEPCCNHVFPIFGNTTLLFDNYGPGGDWVCLRQVGEPPSTIGVATIRSRSVSPALVVAPVPVRSERLSDDWDFGDLFADSSAVREEAEKVEEVRAEPAVEATSVLPVAGIAPSLPDPISPAAPAAPVVNNPPAVEAPSVAPVAGVDEGTVGVVAGPALHVGADDQLAHFAVWAGKYGRGRRVRQGRGMVTISMDQPHLNDGIPVAHEGRYYHACYDIAGKARAYCPHCAVPGRALGKVHHPLYVAGEDLYITLVKEGVVPRGYPNGPYGIVRDVAVPVSGPSLFPPESGRAIANSLFHEETTYGGMRKEKGYRIEQLVLGTKTIVPPSIDVRPSMITTATLRKVGGEGVVFTGRKEGRPVDRGAAGWVQPVKPVPLKTAALNSSFIVKQIKLAKVLDHDSYLWDLFSAALQWAISVRKWRGALELQLVLGLIVLWCLPFGVLDCFFSGIGYRSAGMIMAAALAAFMLVLVLRVHLWRMLTYRTFNVIPDWETAILNSMSSAEEVRLNGAKRIMLSSSLNVDSAAHAAYVRDTVDYCAYALDWGFRVSPAVRAGGL